MQQSLVDVPRQTSKGIAPGDIVLVDKRGRRFHAEVVELDRADSGRYELEVRPIERGITWRTASVREVVAVWRKVRRS
jgi:ASC-1-like (ASCH) protein